MVTAKFKIISIDEHSAERKLSAKDLRKEEIIKAAVSLLAKGGYANFSARGVAKEVGVSLSTVQHYFRSKEDLLVETISDLISSYITKYRILASALEKPALERLEAIGEDLLYEITQPFTCSVFFEMFALAQREPVVSSLTRTMYYDYRNVLKDLIIEINPKYSEENAEVSAMLMVSQMDGLMIFTYNGGVHLPDWNIVRNRALISWRALCFQSPEDFVTV
jgi:AcrR family transcriptional regulator